MPQTILSMTILSLTFCMGCYRGDPTLNLSHEDLDAALWQRTSAEYQVMSRSIYSAAADAVTRGLAEPTWSAIPEQAKELAGSLAESRPKLLPAVILDVDETVLDTSDFQIQQIQEQGQYDPSAWNTWVTACQPKLVPGASEFVQHCREAGVAVYFVTNRDAAVERHTRRNLEEVNLIDRHVLDNILSKNERDAWTVDKTTRRDYVASRYRVLVIVGDDLNDFVWVGDQPTSAARTEQAVKYLDFWSKRWFLLPNANYGGWERAIQGYDDTVTRAEKLRKKLEALTVTGG